MDNQTGGGRRKPSDKYKEAIRLATSYISHFFLDVGFAALKK